MEAAVIIVTARPVLEELNIARLCLDSPIVVIDCFIIVAQGVVAATKSIVDGRADLSFCQGAAIKGFDRLRHLPILQLGLCHIVHGSCAIRVNVNRLSEVLNRLVMFA